MNDVQILSSPKYGDIRTLIINDNPLFCLADVCRALKMVTKNMRARLDDEVVSIHSVVTNGKRIANFVNEDGLYDVILNSPKHLSRDFLKWIIGELISMRTAEKHTSPMRDETETYLCAISVRLQTLEARTEELETKVDELSAQADAKPQLTRSLTLPLSQPKRPIEPPQVFICRKNRDYIIEKIASGIPFSRIGKALGVSTQSVYKYAQREGIWVPTPLQQK